MNKITFLNILMILNFLSCVKKSTSQILNTSGPTHVLPRWYKTPETLENTAQTTWGIAISVQEKEKYFDSVRAALGGVLTTQKGSGLQLPNELYILAISKLSSFLSEKLVQKQVESSYLNSSFLFEGLGSEKDVADCFANSNENWCDYADDILPDSLSKLGVAAGGIPLETKKRILHNIQDIAEFLFVPLDNTVNSQFELPDGGKVNSNAIEFLYETVFLPALGDGVVSAEQERLAWKEIVDSILLGGGFFLEI